MFKKYFKFSIKINKLMISSLLLIFISSNYVIAKTTIEFIQWWQPEMPKGTFQAIIDDFENKNPNIKVKLISGPYSTISQQISVGAATGTLSDVVGLDGAWVNDFAKQGALTPMDPLMRAGNLDPSEIAAIIKIENKSYMFPVATFIYPLFVNLDHMSDAGITGMPKTRSEFLDAAKKLTNKSKNQYGWALPLSMETPWGVQNDGMAWVWAVAGKMMKNGRPNLKNNKDVISMLKFLNDAHKAGVLSPGTLNKKEHDKVEEFANGRSSMIISPIAHINMLRDRNPNLNFTIAALPVVDGFKGKSGVSYAAWGLGISEHSNKKKEAWKLVEHLMSAEVNSRLVSYANAFPGNKKAVPDSVKSDRLMAKAFKIFNNGYLDNEFTGLPVAVELMRMFNYEVQLMIQGKQSPEETAANTHAKWIGEF